jgi:phenylpyruvate tautomerase
MPYLDLITNVKLESPALKSFILEFSKFSADTLGKPESYISVSYTHNETLTFNGSFDPAFQLRIVSLGNLDREKNEKYSQALAAFLKEKLSLTGDRGYIVFDDPGNAFVGYTGTTFATIFESR